MPGTRLRCFPSTLAIQMPLWLCPIRANASARPSGDHAGEYRPVEEGALAASVSVHDHHPEPKPTNGDLRTVKRPTGIASTVGARSCETTDTRPARLHDLDRVSAIRWTRTAAPRVNAIRPSCVANDAPTGERVTPDRVGHQRNTCDHHDQHQQPAHQRLPSPRRLPHTRSRRIRATADNGYPELPSEARRTPCQRR